MTQAQADALKAKREAAIDALCAVAEAEGNQAECDRFASLKAALVADVNEEVSTEILATL
jgi:hypothetical protein